MVSTCSARARVIYVEDNLNVSEIIGSVLELVGLNVIHTFQDYSSAEKYIRENDDYDLLFTDKSLIGAKGEEGNKLIELSKRLRPNIKAILYSGNPSNYVGQSDAFIQKPFSCVELQELLIKQGIINETPFGESAKLDVLKRIHRDRENNAGFLSAPRVKKNC